MSGSLQPITKDELIARLQEIIDKGWIRISRNADNHGVIGNTLEDLLGIPENNLPIPNAVEWELKTQRAGTTSLITLLHKEPSPQAFRFVPQVLLPKYGWGHKEAGGRYSGGERSFRQTISAAGASDRGFKVVIDRKTRRILVSFDAKAVSQRHADWLGEVGRSAGLGELNPQPYWGFDELIHGIAAKLHNSFFVEAEIRLRGNRKELRYVRARMLEKFSFEGFLRQMEHGYAYVDFDARTGHNHGTKFRVRRNVLPNLYESATIVAQQKH